MKGPVCVILLLMCTGLAYSATQVRGGCLFGNKVVSVGEHTFHPCMLMECDTNGQISFTGCPKYACNQNYERSVGWMPEDNTKEYPYCCPYPVCRSIHVSLEDVPPVPPEPPQISYHF